MNNMYIDHVTKSMNKYHLLLTDYSGSFEILFHYGNILLYLHPDLPVNGSALIVDYSLESVISYL